MKKASLRFIGAVIGRAIVLWFVAAVVMDDLTPSLSAMTSMERAAIFLLWMLPYWLRNKEIKE